MAKAVGRRLTRNQKQAATDLAMLCLDAVVTSPDRTADVDATRFSPFNLTLLREVRKVIRHARDDCDVSLLPTSKDEPQRLHVILR